MQFGLQDDGVLGDHMTRTLPLLVKLSAVQESCAPIPVWTGWGHTHCFWALLDHSDQLDGINQILVQRN